MGVRHYACLSILSLCLLLASCGGGANPQTTLSSESSGGGVNQSAEQNGNPGIEQTGGAESPRPGGGGKPSVDTVQLPVGQDGQGSDGDKQCAQGGWRGNTIPDGVRVVVSPDPDLVPDTAFSVSQQTIPDCGVNCLSGFAFTNDGKDCGVTVTASEHLGHTATLTLRGHVNCGTATAADCAEFAKNPGQGFSMATFTQPNDASGDSSGSGDTGPSGTTGPSPPPSSDVGTSGATG